jgi:hypothetical protein
LLTLSATVKEHIERCVAGLGGPRYAIDDDARSHGAIALMGTIGMIWGLRPDGTFWQFDEDFVLDLSPLPQEQETLALANGARRHHWLRAAFPIRPAAATTCPDCQGRASFPVTVGEVMCPSCSGLGWVA